MLLPAWMRLLCQRDKSAQLTSVARKVACGAAEVVPLIQVTNLARTLKTLQQDYNVWIVEQPVKPTAHFIRSKLTGALALVMGAEGDGMRRLTENIAISW